MSYRIRAYRPADRPRVAELMRRLWTRDETLNARYLAWRYESNPYLDGLMAVCEHAGRVVAVRGAHGMRWRAGDATLLMPCLGDTVVEKSHEGRGLVQRLTRWLLEALAAQGIDWVVNQSPGPLVEKLSLRTGWRKVGEWTVARAGNHDAAAAAGFGRFDARPSGSIERDGVRLSGDRPDPAELAELAARTTRGHIGHARDEAYFRWRFDNPFADYRWVCARSDRLAGYLVLGRGLRQRWRTRILDLQGTDGEVQSLLIDQALRWGVFREVLIWWNRFPRAVSRALVEHGFTAAPDDRRRRSRILIAPTRAGAGAFTANDVDLLALANWDPRMIHSDAT